MDGENVEQDVFSFMTTTPNDLVAMVNHERMSVQLITEVDQDRWMAGTPDEAFGLARPYASDAMQIVRGQIDHSDHETA